MVTKDKLERTTTGWRIPVQLRDRVVSWAKGEGLFAENVAAEWLEERLLKEEKKKMADLGKPISRV
jgi:hypothetical protein